MSAMDIEDDNLPEPPGTLEGLTEAERVDEFFRALARGCTVREAAAAVAIPWGTLYRWRREDQAFAKRWEDALRVPVKALEAEALRRAMRGSDRLLMFMLRAADPAKYQQRSEVTHAGGVKLEVVTGVPDDFDPLDMVS